MAPGGDAPAPAVAALACLLLAGCAAAEQAGPATPAATRTLGPWPPIDRPEPVGPAPAGTEARPAAGAASGRTPDLEIRVEARQVEGGAVGMTAVARNLSPSKLYVSAGQCGTPWSDDLLGPRGHVQRRAPAVACGLVEYEEWPPGQSLTATWAWNGTQAVQSGDGWTYEAVEPAEYAWSFTVAASSCASPECGREPASATLPVAVRRLG